MSDASHLAHNAHAPNLFETRDGSILHCACCDRLQITFRGLTLLISTDRFDALRRKLATAWDEIRRRDDACAWRLSAETDAGPITVTLDRTEVRRLQDLLDGASTMRTLRDSLAAVGAGEGRNTVPSAESVWGRPSA
jgi:hypothetical protein